MLERLQAHPNSLLMQRIETGGRIGRHAAAWLMLVWSVWIFLTPLSTPRTFPDWLVPTLASYAVFLMLFYCAYYRDRRFVPWCVAGFAVLGYTVTPFNAGAHGYLIYACAFLAFCAGSRTALAGMATLLGLHALEWLLLGWPPVYLVGGIIVGLAVGLMNLAMVRRMQAQAALRLSHDEVRRLASLAERERIGRDLHDLLGHTLSLITLKLELSRKLFDRDAERSRIELAEAEQIARDALAQVRSAVTGFRAADLAAELASAHLLLESSRVHLRYSPPPAMPAWIESGLAMILREAVTNIARHAQANEAMIAVRSEGNAVVLEVVDDGRGGVSANGNGLAGMRERVEAMGGTLAIDSPRSHGTRLEVRIPVNGVTTASIDHAALAMRHDNPLPDGARA